VRWTNAGSARKKQLVANVNNMVRCCTDVELKNRY
jgi:hypothetical protein